jgi:hypothetical protein
MRLYIAGPMTGYENYNFDAFNAMSKLLTEMGHEVYNPATSFGGRQDLPYDVYLRHAVVMVSMVEGVVVLPFAADSKGALTEMHIALSCDIPIYMELDGVLVKQSITHASLAKWMGRKYAE